MELGADCFEVGGALSEASIKMEGVTSNTSVADDFSSQLNASSWEQDVLLSNAGLPEINPLLELENSVEEDFQKMLNDWENHIGAIQVLVLDRYALRNMIRDK